MDLYTVAVVTANELTFSYTCLALTDEQAISLCFRYHNRQHSKEAAFLAARKGARILSKRRLRPGVIEFRVPTLG